jgi:myo-inositol catabolism protein IolC
MRLSSVRALWTPFPGETIMNLGYDRPLYLLPFDHRHSYVSGIFHATPPLTRDQHEAVTDSKRVIYDGFRQALSRVPVGSASILVDEEFGAGILRDATENGYVTALSTEKSGSDEFEFEYGTAFAEHIEAFKPTFAKVLVRYNPEGDAVLNQRQTTRLKQLSDYCRAVGQRFMFELLVPATQEQEKRFHADDTAYDLEMRPRLTREAIRTLTGGLRARRRGGAAWRPGRSRMHRARAGCR